MYPPKSRRLHRWVYPRQPEGSVVRQWTKPKILKEIETYVVTSEVVYVSLRQHSVVLELRFAQRRCIAGDDDELCLSRAEGLEGRLVSEGDCRLQVSNCNLEQSQMLRVIAYLYQTS